jgi:hypothetical protein
MKLFHLGHEEMFALHGSINHLIKAVGGSDGLPGGGIPGRELWAHFVQARFQQARFV